MEITSRGLLPELLVLGIPEVDAQHEGIFYRIENLKFLCLESSAPPRAAFAELLAYLGEHFHTEEVIALAAGLDFTEHAEMHSQTLITLSGWVSVVISGQRDVFSFLRYLEIWFERHIREEDQPFARQLHASGVVPGATT
ncbi:MAG: hemerythrin-like metal-binding protein [Proteobacteria bacterium]|nr:hemerythrin-like metal-binding protein [Pseudomonadota bacterium]